MILVVEASDPWIEFYKSGLGSLELEILWARTLPEAYFAWRMHGFEITAVILDENLISEYGDPATFAHQARADWSAREVEGVLVLVADSPHPRRDLELEGFIQTTKENAICTMLSNLPVG